MKNHEIDCSKYNIVGGKIESSKNQFENLKHFIQRWKMKIGEIENICLSNDRAYKVASDFLIEWEKFMN